jgi:hypothetical protein
MAASTSTLERQQDLLHGRDPAMHEQGGVRGQGEE